MSPLCRVGWAVLALHLGCAQPWIQAPLATLNPNTATAARLRLRDRTLLTVRAPRIQGATVTGAEVTECLGESCETYAQRLSVPQALVVGLDVLPRRPPPAARVDVLFALPHLQAPLGVGSSAVGGVAFDVRGLLDGGWGASVRWSLATSFELGLGPPQTVREAFGEGWVLDLAAVRRLALSGDDHRGAAIDFDLGASAGNLGWDNGHSAYVGCPLISITGCGPTTVYTPPPRPYADGARLGAVVGTQLSVRTEAFVAGLAFAWRPMFLLRTSTVAEEPWALSIVTFDLFLGFGLRRSR